MNFCRIYLYNTLKLNKGPEKVFLGSKIESFFVKVRRLCNHLFIYFNFESKHIKAIGNLINTNSFIETFHQIPCVLKLQCNKICK
jgi:hypothetical protein